MRVHNSPPGASALAAAAPCWTLLAMTAVCGNMMHRRENSSCTKQQEWNAYEQTLTFALSFAGTCPAFAGFRNLPIYVYIYMYMYIYIADSLNLAADEMGLGKTVQMLAVIVSSVCTRREAEMALSRAAREQNNAELHVLGSEARRARQEAAEEARRLQDSPGPESGPSATAVKKARKIVWQVERPGLCLLLQLYTQAARAMTTQHDLDTPEPFMMHLCSTCRHILGGLRSNTVKLTR